MTKNYIISFVLIAFSWLSGQPNQGFFLNDWEPKQIELPPSIDAQKPTAAPTVTVAVNCADTVTRVCKYIFGNNANTWSGKMHNNKALVTNISNMKPNVIRYPGGNLSSDFFWNREQNDRPDDIPKTINPWYGMTKENWIMAVDDFYLLLQKTNSVGIITVNYSYARYGLSVNPVAKAAHLAAEWVRYDAGRTTFWEIGNENFGNWQSGYEIDVNLNQDGQPKRISGDLYGKHAMVFIDSMRTAAAEISHEIKIGVQTFEAETSWDPVQTDWNEKMFAVIGNAADFFIVHNYYTNYDEDSNAQTILATFNKSASFKKAVYKDAGELGVEPKPIALTEWNIFAVRSMQQVSHINGLHASLVLGQLIQDEYGSAMRWDLANGWGNGDDHGTFSRADEPGVPEFSPRPVFYHMTYFQKYFGDVMVSARVSGSRDIIAFASSFSNGPAGIVLINKGKNTQIVKLELDHFIAGEKYYYYTMIGDNDNGEFSRKVMINGQGPDRVAGGPADYHSLAAMASPTSGGLVLNCPPYSAIYMLVDGHKDLTDVQEAELNSPHHFSLLQNYPNPFNPTTTLGYYLHKPGYVRLIIFDITGKKVRTLVEEQQTVGLYQFMWNGLDDSGRQLPSAVYYYSLAIDGYAQTRKLTLIR